MPTNDNRNPVYKKYGKHEYAVVPFPLYQRMVEAMEEREDIAALMRIHAGDDGFRGDHEGTLLIS